MSQKYQQRNSRLGKVCVPRKSRNILTTPRHRHQLPQNCFLRRFRFIYLKLLRLRGKPKFVAKGLAVGIFAGCFPFFGIQSLIGIFLATVCRGSKVAALAATWISNPLTYVPLYVFNYKIGKLLLRTQDAALPPLDIESFTAFKELGSTFAITLLTGSFVIGTILAVITYFYSLAILEKWHDRSISRRNSRKKG
ncbi:MAG: DUF2062 domain-containing protein [Cyanobacteria bacterium P01_G01_bin.39]